MNGSLFFSDKGLAEGSSYQVSSGGKITNATDSWNGWMENGDWSDGSSIGSFTIKGSITTIGSSFGPGNNGGFPGIH